MTSLPSQFLPPLHPPPALPTLVALLAQLRAQLVKDKIEIDLSNILSQTNDDEANNAIEDQNDEDVFEDEFVRGWLERVVVVGTKAIAREGDEKWEAVVEDAASLVAALAGDCASGGTTTTYKLPTPTNKQQPHQVDVFNGTALPPSFYPTPPATRPISPLPQEALSITIQSTTLLGSTGFRTWSSAEILAADIATNPTKYCSPGHSPDQIPLRVVELGAGTGLSGLAAAAVFASVGQRATVDLTDYDQPVLDNLVHNIKGNALPCSAENGGAGLVTRSVFALDWIDVARSWTQPPNSATRPRSQRYDLILGADLIYEQLHFELLHPTISSLLRFPSDDGATPAFFLVLPLRPTHTEHRSFDTAFSQTKPEAGTPGVEFWHNWSQDEFGKKWIPRTVDRQEVTTHDGFTGKAHGGLRKHHFYRIEWVAYIE